jgi:hypothetical protein
MAETRASKLLVWTGPLAFVVFLVAIFVLEGSTPDADASADKVMAYYNGRSDRSLISAFLAPLVAALLVVFASRVSALARRRGNDGAGPSVLISGAVLWGSGILISSMLELALLDASDNGQAGVAETLNVLNASSWLPFIAGTAVMLIGAGMTVLGTPGLLPSWLGWIGLVIGIVALFGPGGFAAFFVGPLWVLAAGLLLGLRSTESTAAQPVV